MSEVNTMELDDLKQAWRTIDAQVERLSGMHLMVLRDRRIEGARKGLRPLFVRQLAQLLFGLAMIVLGVSVWRSALDQPALLIAGITLHLYGIGVGIFSGLVMARIRGIDYAASVVTIQRDLAGLRRLYIRGGMAVGLPWWFLWVVALMGAMHVAFGVDVYANSPGFVVGSVIFGLIGLVATLIFDRWAHRPARADFGQRLDDAAAGGGLRRAHALLAELERFEAESGAGDRHSGA